MNFLSAPISLPASNLVPVDSSYKRIQALRSDFGGKLVTAPEGVTAGVEVAGVDVGAVSMFGVGAKGAGVEGAGPFERGP